MKIYFYLAIIVAFPCLGIWNIIEFILYVAHKNPYVAHKNPFEWAALWLLCVDIFLLFCMAVEKAVKMQREENERENKRQESNPFGNSKFEKRLAEAQRQQQEANKSNFKNTP